MSILDDVQHILAAYKRLPRAGRELVLLEMHVLGDAKFTTEQEESAQPSPTYQRRRRMRQPIGPELEQAVLRELESGPKRMREVAQAVGRAVSSTTNAVRKLEERGLVERHGLLLEVKGDGANEPRGQEPAPKGDAGSRRRVKQAKAV